MALPKPKKLSIVLVIWRDITDHEGWNDTDLEPSFDAAICHSVGWLLSRSPSLIKITETISPEHSEEGFGTVKCIPAGCVVSIKKLK